MAAAKAEVLVLPQWQGYAASDAPAEGARALASALAGAHEGALRMREVDVPAWHPLAAPPAGVLGLAEIADQATAAVRWLDANRPERLLVFGGDCGSDFGPISWQAARPGGALGVLYLDAHADLNTPASSPSGRFHGMVLRAALGEGARELAALCPRPLAPAQVILAGTRDLDPAERAFLASAGVAPWPSAAIDDGRVLAAVCAHPAQRWHVHFDLDVVDPVDFPEVTVPTPGGPTLDAVTRLLAALVARRDVVSMTITEHVGGERSALRIAGVLAALRRAGWG